MILWSEWYNVPNEPNDTMILMIQCTKWFEWYNDPNNTMVWLIDKNELAVVMGNDQSEQWLKCLDI